MSLPSYYITEITVVEYGILRIVFVDGLSGEVDVLDRLWGPVFERARTETGFSEAYLDREAGTVAWPGGAGLAPDTLYERVRTGAWPVPGIPA